MMLKIGNNELMIRNQDAEDKKLWFYMIEFEDKKWWCWR